MPRDDREQNFEKALARNLQSSFASSNPSAPNADCLDAETLAAYHDRLLDPDEMAQRKVHIAACQRCQEILAQLEATDEIPVEADRDLLLDAGAMTADVPEPASEELHLAAVSVGASPASPAPDVPDAAERKIPITITTLKPSRSLERPKMVRWIALAGALAAGLIVWAVFRERPPQSFDLAKNQQQTSVPDASQPYSYSSAPPASSAPADSASQRKEQSESARPEVQNAPATAKSRSTAETADAITATTPTSPASSLQKQAPAKKDASPSASPKPPAAANQIASAAAPSGALDAAASDLAAKRGANNLSRDLKRESDLRSAAPKAANGNAASDSVSASTLPATPPPAPAQVVVVPDYARDTNGRAVLKESPSSIKSVTNVSSPPSAAETFVAAPNRVLSALAPLSVPAPGGTTVWRIGRAGMIQHSSDSGATWAIQPSGIVSDLIAGSAYTDQVCWLVGRAGTILRTTDGGATWQKITAPTSVDFVSVFAINAQSATITDDAGHSYQTSSAGQRWSRTLLSH